MSPSKRVFITGASAGFGFDTAKALVEEVERPEGERPLRRTVGHDVREAVSAINRTCAEVQDHLQKALRLR